MICNTAQVIVVDPAYLRSEERQPPSHLHHFTYNSNLVALWRRSQICDAQVSSYAPILEGARSRGSHQNRRGEVVDERRCASAVEIAHVVSHARRDEEAV
jgi:hypothetical protein